MTPADIAAAALRSGLAHRLAELGLVPPDAALFCGAAALEEPPDAAGELAAAASRERS
jgi:hypothetical protein